VILKLRRALGCAAFLLMSYTPIFTYSGGANPPIDYPRLLVSDTQQFAADGVTPIYIFSDQEIGAATNIEINVWQSAQYYSGPQGITPLPSIPVPYRRIAATLLDALAANKARLAAVQQILDVKLAPEKAAAALAAQAKAYREADDESGAFVIIEQVNDVFSFRDRFWKTVQRQQAGGFIG
jgi:hypothetical protein